MMDDDSITALATAAQKFIERYQKFERPSAVVSAMREDIDVAIADRIDYQTPLVSCIYQICTRWPNAAAEAAIIRTLADNYASLLTALTAREPRPWLDDGSRLWNYFAEAQAALTTRAQQLDSIVVTKPNTYGRWNDDTQGG